MKLSLLVIASATALSVSAAAAQQQTITCPATVSVRISQVDKFEYDPGGGSIEGFKQVFLPNAVVRLKAAVAGVGEPDNMEAKPGAPIRWTIWDGKAAPMAEMYVATCAYEGGFELKTALNKNIRNCTSVRKELPSPPNNPSYGPTLPQTAIDCR